jgi:hypothetical protein
MERAILDDKRFAAYYALGGMIRSPKYQDVLYFVLR